MVRPSKLSSMQDQQSITKYLAARPPPDLSSCPFDSRQSPPLPPTPPTPPEKGPSRLHDAQEALQDGNLDLAVEHRDNVLPGVGAAPGADGRAAAAAARGVRPGLHAANAARDACTDKVGETFAFYSDVPSVLHGLAAAGVRLGVASRTHAPDLGREMLKLLHVPAPSALFPGADEGALRELAGGRKGKGDKARKAFEFFDGGLEIYPSSKIRHFEALGKRTGIPYTDMLFFDDESRNRDTETLGVTMWLVRDGVTWGEIEKGIQEWRRRRARDG
ncbi:hypothetical protein TruAng_009112 [Truncatella angustata]|nr:hypothetical protein TruAng_009112 [Truncatella angustata]